MMHIAFAFDDGFLEPTLVALGSVLITNSFQEINFHILSRSLSQKTKDLFNQTVTKFSKVAKLSFYDVDEKVVDNLSEIGDNKCIRITKGMYYRFFLPQLLPHDVSKVLYMDGDIICTGNLKEFYDTNIDCYACAGVHDDVIEDEGGGFIKLGIERDKGYVNSGVLLINIDYWRKNCIATSAISFLSEYSDMCKYYDQDAINKVCSGKVIFAHRKHNAMTYLYNKYIKGSEKLNQEQNEAIMSPLIIHYTAIRKPWFIESSHPLKDVWRAVYKRVFGKYPHLKHCYRGKTRFLWTVKYLLNKFRIKHYNEYKVYSDFNDTIIRCLQSLDSI